MPGPVVNARKRPVQARSAETVHAIVEAAARILEADGLDGYTTNAVAKRAGVSVGSLYQYFPGKDALTAALIERETALLLADIAAIAAGDGGEAGLRQLIGACVKHQMRRPVLARLLDFEERRLPLRQTPGAPDVATRAIAAMLRRSPGASGGGGVPTAAADTVAIIKGMVDGAGERGETDPAALGVRVERAVFGYLRSRPC